MKALVLYHSLFGNTKTVAIALAKGIQDCGIETTCSSIDEFDITQISQHGFIAIGSPTHMIRPSKEMKEFLNKLKSFNLEGRYGFSFDTRIVSRMNKRSWSVFENSAARTIEGAMKRRKMKIIRPRASAIVEGREGPLNSEVQDAFLKIGREIGQLLGTSKKNLVDSLNT